MAITGSCCSYYQTCQSELDATTNSLI